MENSIKLYKELSYIETFDGEVIALTEDFGAVAEELNNDKRFLNVWNQMIAKSSIKRAFVKQTDEIDNALLQISDKNLRARMQAEVDERRKTWSRLNMEIYKNILDRLSK